MVGHGAVIPHCEAAPSVSKQSRVETLSRLDANLVVAEVLAPVSERRVVRPRRNEAATITCLYFLDGFNAAAICLLVFSSSVCADGHFFGGTLNGPC